MSSTAGPSIRRPKISSSTLGAKPQSAFELTSPARLGSTLLRPSDTPSTLVGFARWQRRDDVEAFWTSGNATPLPGATLESIEILDEVEHMTLEHVANTEDG